MRRTTVGLVVVAALVVSVTWVASAAPPEIKATALHKPISKMPLAEFKALPVPAGIRLAAKVNVRHLPPPSVPSGPDLLVLDPTYLNPPRMGAAAGFPAAAYAGWRADWVVKNVGNAVAPPGWKIQFSCQVINVPPGTEYYEYLSAKWCPFNEGYFPFPAGATFALPANGQTPMGMFKTFTGYPLFTCEQPNAPRPRVTVKVDAENKIAEANENNNGYEVDMCCEGATCPHWQ